MSAVYEQGNHMHKEYCRYWRQAGWDDKGDVERGLTKVGVIGDGPHMVHDPDGDDLSIEEDDDSDEELFTLEDFQARVASLEDELHEVMGEISHATKCIKKWEADMNDVLSSGKYDKEKASKKKHEIHVKEAMKESFETEAAELSKQLAEVKAKIATKIAEKGTPDLPTGSSKAHHLFSTLHETLNGPPYLTGSPFHFSPSGSGSIPPLFPGASPLENLIKANVSTTHHV
jgi:hypothetical protein